jgi:cell division protein FtsI (penicillin-binding protein 3)
MTATARGARHGTGGRGLWLLAVLALAFLAVAGQLVRLAIKGQGAARFVMAEPVTRGTSRPDITDRHGRLLATDVEVHSLYADPLLVLDPDEASERLAEVLPELDQGELRRMLADRGRRFVWIRRGLAPGTAQRIHDLGLPGLLFRRELKRAYPGGRLAGHVLGGVNVDNRGLAGIERHIDEVIGLESVLEARALPRRPVRLSLDLGVQHAVEAELAEAMTRYRARAASGLLVDAHSGEVVASASLPGADPGRPVELRDPERIDRTATGTYELGSIFKAVTVAMALEQGIATADKVYDVRAPLRLGPHLVRDLHPLGRPLSVREIFVHSSNVGAGMIALEAGAERQRAFLARLGLTQALRTEVGPITPPQLPTRWGPAETATIAYGHGIAVAPLQFVAAAAQLFNGGLRVLPTFLAAEPGTHLARTPVLSPGTSRALNELMRRNVALPTGTGRKAEVAGLEVGGKTGTAELADRGGYRESAVVASFLAAFPASGPRYVMLVSLFEPHGTSETGGRITAGLNAVPVAGRILARIAPLLDVTPATR